MRRFLLLLAAGDSDFGPNWELPLFSPMDYLHHPQLLLQQPLALLSAGLWIWMLVHCIRNDPERNIWLWILFIGNVPAALIYFFVRWLPGARFSAGPSLLSRWTKSRQIPRLEAAARNIGNAQQYVELGEACRETGKLDRAADCFSKALQKDPVHMAALWGAAQLELQRQDFGAARTHLETILARDPSYKFGDVSLAHCRTLYSLKLADEAQSRLENHLKRWTHPEAYVLLASLQFERGDHVSARKHLEATLIDLRAGPAFFARQNRVWARKARKLLGRLPRE